MWIELDNTKNLCPRKLISEILNEAVFSINSINGNFIDVVCVAGNYACLIIGYELISADTGCLKINKHKIISTNKGPDDKMTKVTIESKPLKKSIEAGMLFEVIDQEQLKNSQVFIIAGYSQGKFQCHFFVSKELFNYDSHFINSQCKPFSGTVTIEST
ncbi:MAG: hypothetical protein EHM12_11180 [Dehalococcoidia bacterium]|nr:MAG: hypothetical protein EHM12_11180 [Dehalococcoidia bacterium]